MRRENNVYKVPMRSIYCDSLKSWLRAILWCFVVLKIWPSEFGEIVKGDGDV